MRRFPWSELHLDGPADERAIRRAYAARLKIVRPDVDAAGFQRLVEARDAALLWAANAPVVSVQREELAPVEPEAQAEASSAVVASDETETAEPPAESSHAVPLAPAGIDTNSTAPPSNAMAEAATRPSRPSAGDPDIVVAQLAAFLEAWRSKGELPPVAPILRSLGDLSIDAHQRIEPDALKTVLALFEGGLFKRALFKARQHTARALIVGLDDDYAWTENDRRLYAILPPASADRVARLLRHVRVWDRTGVAPKLTARRWAPRWTLRWTWGGGNLRTALYAFIVLSGVARAISNWPTHPNAADQKPISPPPSAFSSFPPVPPPPNETVSIFNRGVEHDKAARHDLAIAEYDQVLQRDPNYVLAFFNRGLDYLRFHRFDRAIQDFDQAIRLDPAYADAFVGRGAAFAGEGQYDRAIEDYDEAIRLMQNSARVSPNRTVAFVDRGFAYLATGRYDRAIQDFDRALAFNPNAADALYYRGRARRAKGDADGDADIARARQINPALPAVPVAARKLPNLDVVPDGAEK